MPAPDDNNVRAVLVVDDNPADREWCRIVLKKTGRFDRVLEAGTAVTALKMLDGSEEARVANPDLPPVIILLDINMPGLNGFEFLDEFSKIRDELNTWGGARSIVLMLSSSNDPRDRKRAGDTGLVDEFLTKPLSIEQAASIADRFGLFKAS